MKMKDMNHQESRPRAMFTLVILMGFVVCAPASARADLALGIVAGTATPGSASNSFDVTLTNNGPNSVNVGGFSFALTAGSSDVNFSDVNISTQSAPYIFGLNSEFGPDITLNAAGNVVSAADNDATPFGSAALTSGQTLDLGHVIFALDADAPATSISLTFSDYPATGVNDANGVTFANVTFPSPGSASIPVGSAAPEPASLVLGLQGLLLAGFVAYRARACGF